jgi:hypothetical protein
MVITFQNSAYCRTSLTGPGKPSLGTRSMSELSMTKRPIIT